MSDLIERDKAIEAIAEHLMGEAMCDYPDASDNIEDWKEIGEAILESIPPAEVVPKGSDEASLAYAEGWKNGEEAERSRYKTNNTDGLIERDKAIAVLYKCTPFEPKGIALLDKCEDMIRAIPSARPTNRGICGVCAGRKVCGKNNRNLDMLECSIFELDEHYKISRPKGEWIRGEDGRYFCDNCGCVCGRYSNHSDPLHGNRWNYYFCPNCGADMREREGE